MISNFYTVWSVCHFWWPWRGWRCKSCQQVNYLCPIRIFFSCVSYFNTCLILGDTMTYILNWWLLLLCRILPENVAHILSQKETVERVLTCGNASDVLKCAFDLTEAALNHQYEVFLLIWLSCPHFSIVKLMLLLIILLVSPECDAKNEVRIYPHIYLV